MAIFHLNVRGIAPAKGSSAVASSAYQSGERLRDERTGELKSYARAERVAAVGVELPDGAPAWAADRGRLWNEATRAWGGGTELVARRHEFALPRELDGHERVEAVREYCARLTAEGHACDWAIHDSSDGNPHAHVLESMLALAPGGFERPTAKKSTKLYLCRDAAGNDVMVPAADWKAAKAEGVEKVYNFNDGVRRTMGEAARAGLTKADRKSKTPVAVTTAPDGARAFDAEKARLRATRAAWARIANRHLAAHAERYGTEAASIDHRSNAERGIELAPTAHEGPRPDPEVVESNERVRGLNAAILAARSALDALKRRAAEARDLVARQLARQREALGARCKVMGGRWTAFVAPPAPEDQRAVSAAMERQRAAAEAAFGVFGPGVAQEGVRYGNPSLDEQIADARAAADAYNAEYGYGYDYPDEGGRGGRWIGR